jgi:hypothetical protein
LCIYPASQPSGLLGASPVWNESMDILLSILAGI